MSQVEVDIARIKLYWILFQNIGEGVIPVSRRKIQLALNSVRELQF